MESDLLPPVSTPRVSAPPVKRWGRARYQGSGNWVFALALLSGVMMIGIVVGLFVLLDPRRQIMADLARVQPGMTPAQVDAVMAGYVKGTGWFPPQLGASTKPGVLATVGGHSHTISVSGSG